MLSKDRKSCQRLGKCACMPSIHLSAFCAVLDLAPHSSMYPILYQRMGAHFPGNCGSCGALTIVVELLCPELDWIHEGVWLGKAP